MWLWAEGKRGKRAGWKKGADLKGDQVGKKRGLQPCYISTKRSSFYCREYSLNHPINTKGWRGEGLLLPKGKEGCAGRGRRLKFYWEAPLVHSRGEEKGKK